MKEYSLVIYLYDFLSASLNDKFCSRVTYIWIWFSYEWDIIKILDFVASKEVFNRFSSYGRVGCSGNRWRCCGSGGPPCGSWWRVWCPRNCSWCSGLGSLCWSCYWHAAGRSCWYEMKEYTLLCWEWDSYSFPMKLLLFLLFFHI